MFEATQLQIAQNNHFDQIHAFNVSSPMEAVGPDNEIRLTVERPRIETTDSVPRRLLADPAHDAVALLSQFRAGFKTGSIAEYIPVPRHPRLTGAPCWRIELHGLAPDAEPLGLDILGDVVMGRGSEADLNLESYLGYEQAVSRRHALLRPSPHQLHLIDLGSRNGTLCNTVPIGKASRSLKSDDMISLGLLNFTIKIIDGPIIGA